VLSKKNGDNVIAHLKQLKISIMRNKNRPVSAFLTNVISFEITEFIP
jgi:hypothetical protein